MPQKESEAVPEGNGPIPMLGRITLEDFRRVMLEVWDRKMDKLTEDLRRSDQRLGSLEQDARQSRPAMKADGQADTKTRERTEGAVAAVQAMDGDSISVNRVQAGPKTTSTTFGEKVKPPALPCRDDIVVENCAAVPKSCLSPLEMRISTAAGGLLPTGKTTTATWTTLDRPTIWPCLTKEKKLRTSTPYALYYNSSLWLNQLPAPSWRRVIQTKSRQNLMVDPGGSRSSSRLPVSGNVAWRALLCGEVHAKAG